MSNQIVNTICIRYFFINKLIHLPYVDDNFISEILSTILKAVDVRELMLCCNPYRYIVVHNLYKNSLLFSFAYSYVAVWLIFF